MNHPLPARPLLPAPVAPSGARAWALLLWPLAALAVFGGCDGCSEAAVAVDSGAVPTACMIDPDCEGSDVCVNGACIPTDGSDRDGDGVPDSTDNCPGVFNPGQDDSDGNGVGDLCEADADRDGDGVPNSVDNCPDFPNPGQDDADSDDIGDLCDSDRDGDGVDGRNDNCPDLPNPDQADQNQNGIGDACENDGDLDGVPDDRDNCPLVANPGQEDLDGDQIGDACDGDVDGDGVGNAGDNCLRVANPGQDNRDGDERGDACDDDDGDGLVDADDNCPDTPNPTQADLDQDDDGDACDDDDDGDGVLDAIDNCPRSANPNQADLDEDGVGDVCDPNTTRTEGLPTDASCAYAPPVGQFAPTVEWSFAITAQHPYPDRTQVMMTPVVVNLTDDNADGNIDTRDIPDIVFTTFASSNDDERWDELRYGVLRAVSGDGSGLLWSVGPDELSAFHSSYDGNSGIQPGGSIAAADIDGDGFVEIVAGLWDDGAETGGLLAVSHRGQVEWRSAAFDAAGRRSPRQFQYWWGGPSLADLDGDGGVEIVVGAMVFDRFGNLRFDGTQSADLVWAAGAGQGINWPAGDATGTLYTGMLSVVADLDQTIVPGLNRRTQEVVTGRAAYRADGSVLWEADASLPDGFPALPDGFPAVGDFDLDGEPEVVVSASGTVRVHDGSTGAVVWGPVTITTPSGASGGRIGPPTVADFDGDGVPEVGVAGRNQYVALKVDLSRPATSFADARMWAVDTLDASSNMTGSSVFDFEGDGRAEVIYNDELHLRVFDGVTGAVLYEQPNTSFTALEYPIVADVDNDGQAEIVVGTNDFECGDQLSGCARGFSGIRVFGDAEDNWVSTRRIWNQHSYHITHVDERGRVPAAESPSWTAHNTYRLNALLSAPAQAAPDLVAADPTTFGEGCFGEVQAWVHNRGASRVGAGVPVSFYLVRGGVESYLGTSRTLLPLEPGDGERVSLNLTLSGPGAASVRVRVDDAGPGVGGVENECDESNNTLEVTLSFTCGG